VIQFFDLIFLTYLKDGDTGMFEIVYIQMFDLYKFYELYQIVLKLYNVLIKICYFILNVDAIYKDIGLTLSLFATN
jgi:hypothetical protein